MSDLALIPAATPAPGPQTAAELAARIPIPTRLPVRYDGEHLRHLSASSYTKWVTCPETWRRDYIKGERTPPSGAMFLGGRVDDALSAYHRHTLQSGKALTLEQVQEHYREGWRAELTVEQAKLGVDWDEELTQKAAFEIGLQAIALAFKALLPHVGRPVAVQRKVEFAIAPELQWTILCYLDLETVRPGERGEPAPAVVDYKVKNSLISQDGADHDPQAALYLAGRWLEGHPASEFTFAQIAKPGKRRKEMGAALVTTRRSAGQLRGVLARIALAASQIAASYERYGPDQPWGFADPTGWKCSPRYCAHYPGCPGGAGISGS
jgi:hypothetical protein